MKKRLTPSRVVVISFNPTLGDSIIVIRVLLAMKKHQPGLRIYYAVPRKVKDIFAFFVPTCEKLCYTPNKIYERPHSLTRIKIVLARLKIFMLMWLKFSNCAESTIVGPEWFGHSKVELVKKPTLGFLLGGFGLARSESEEDRRTYLLRGIQKMSSLGLASGLISDSSIETSQGLGGEPSEQITIFPKTRISGVLIVLGSGSKDRDWTRLVLPRIQEYLVSSDIDFFVFDGNLKQGLSFITLLMSQSDLIVCNDTGWFHLAQGLNKRILCFASEEFDSKDFYVRGDSSCYVIRPITRSEKSEKEIENSFVLGEKQIQYNQVDNGLDWFVLENKGNF